MSKLSGVTKTFGDTIALDDLSFQVNDGEVVALLGPNGAGKTTTMRIMTGFLIPDTGEVIINDYPLRGNELWAKALIGYMPESNPIYKDMLVKDLLDLTLNIHQIEDKKEQIDSVVNATGIGSVYYRPISELSKGFRQRVGIAQALIIDPEILVLDEPTEGLDPNQRNEIRKLIREIGKKRTVIISTHVMQEVEAMCDRMIIINRGKIVADGSKEEIHNLAKGANSYRLVIGCSDKKLALSRLKELKDISSVKAIESSKSEKSF
jgi:ABC-2 type transport system ATP-binding protein